MYPKQHSRNLQGFKEDAKKAMAASPDYFVWWYTTKSLALVGVSLALVWSLASRRRRR